MQQIAHIKNKYIKNKYIKNINNYKSDKPYWMDHPEVCVSKNASSKEQAEIEKILEKFK